MFEHHESQRAHTPLHQSFDRLVCMAFRDLAYGCISELGNHLTTREPSHRTEHVRESVSTVTSIDRPSWLRKNENPAKCIRECRSNVESHWKSIQRSFGKTKFLANLSNVSGVALLDVFQSRFNTLSNVDSIHHIIPSSGCRQ